MKNNMISKIDLDNFSFSIDDFVVGEIVDLNDPEYIGRIKVKIDTLTDENGIWAYDFINYNSINGIRIPYNKGDKVLISFLNNDMSIPYVIGRFIDIKKVKEDDSDFILRDTFENLFKDWDNTKLTKNDILYTPNVLYLGALDSKVDFEGKDYSNAFIKWGIVYIVDEENRKVIEKREYSPNKQGEIKTYYRNDLENKESIFINNIINQLHYEHITEDSIIIVNTIGKSNLIDKLNNQMSIIQDSDLDEGVGLEVDGYWDRYKKDDNGNNYKKQFKFNDYQLTEEIDEQNAKLNLEIKDSNITYSITIDNKNKKVDFNNGVVTFIIEEQKINIDIGQSKITIDNSGNINIQGGAITIQGNSLSVKAPSVSFTRS